MKSHQIVMVISCLITSFLLVLLIPSQRAFVLTEERTKNATMYYYPISEDRLFHICYAHSIFQSDVWEAYQVTKEDTIKLLNMRYEDIGIGLPASAEEDQILTYDDGVYTLQFHDRILPFFSLHIGNISAQLKLYYDGMEIDLKQQLKRGTSYTFQIQKLSFYQKMKGVEMHGNRKQAEGSGST